MIEIDIEKCIGCGVCAEICPFGAIRIISERAVVLDSCALCGACLYECPVGAIVMEESPAPAADITRHRDIWVWLETVSGQIKSVGLELLGVGRQLADARSEKLVGVLIGDRLEGLAETAIAHGADQVWRVTSPELKWYETGMYTAAMAELARRHYPAVILFGATPNGRDLAPRVAARLNTGLTADCTGLSIEPETGSLLQTRPAFGGNIMATIVTPKHRPQLATVRPRVMKPLPFDHGRRGDILNWPLDPTRTQLTRILRHIPSASPRTSLEDAEIIVAGGRGAGGPAGLKLLGELASVLGGTLAVSRAPVDEGWISSSYQVGQTGKTVAPKLYVACGISGTLQHLVGIQGAEVIVAINKDPRAPIFKAADYGLVGDIFEIVPRLIKEIRALRPTISSV